MQSRSTRGFTLIELITVVVFMGLLASIATLKYIDLTREGYVTQVSGDIDAAKVAALSYYGDRDEWPATSDLGTPPPELVPYLPGGGLFNRPRWRMAWINQPISGSPPLLGIMVRAEDPDMMAKLVQRFGNRAPFVVTPSEITYLLSTPQSGF